ncbi:hypothetical protein EO98_17650 [Methanosarcina sp. 2.H.T.1A.6]|uniref:DUF429 domain-containing protein n=1 Tax=unclassified Methanosarcina TaxID=2644672 RepID=UPI00062123AA|nr:MULTISPECIES: DUF429 domain-containing protein [unclassified Methanosarcina]KKG14639.1 hypothetical protein EO94_01600 [Methanosarcina sp. 2.H.T.1A.3]KKG24573.1 hypothetical protein EO98_17650 [Methanosarcina sp. 2.H.T.1A.6]KKG25826.1 hypothetical protein EO96_19570 [Methanosarcina sp. 2.H.T.1A.8]KKG26624.1 hypothetical protein EO97_15735 [Methanosarcina sp. 2.H.T.1A.15]
MKNLFPKSTIYGVDFSGSKEACKKIWVCESISTDKGLLVKDCWNLKEKYGNLSRDRSFEILTKVIASSPRAAFGLDFPFGLPKSIIDEDNWIDFIKNFSKNYGDPYQFRQRCHDRALKLTGKKELRRYTDIENGSPFPPCNLRLFKQTYYGINNVLRPLVMSKSAKILPMEDQEISSPWVLEICPASTLKDLDLYFTGYKGKESTSSELRETILSKLKKSEFVTGIDSKVWKTSVENAEGDALDSVIAAIATYRGLYPDLNLDDIYKLEGYIYV